jgi:hypothetical protein
MNQRPAQSVERPTVSASGALAVTRDGAEIFPEGSDRFFARLDPRQPGCVPHSRVEGLCVPGSRASPLAPPLAECVGSWRSRSRQYLRHPPDAEWP